VFIVYTNTHFVPHLEAKLLGQMLRLWFKSWLIYLYMYVFDG